VLEASWFASLYFQYSEGRLSSVRAVRRERWLSDRNLVFSLDTSRRNAWEAPNFQSTFPP
jgi:hypothetical protein